MGRAIFYSIFAFIFLWIGVKLTPYAYDLYKKGKASEVWVPVDAQILSFEIKSSGSTLSGPRRTGGASTATVDVAYRYEFENREYDGDTTSFGPPPHG